MAFDYRKTCSRAHEVNGGSTRLYMNVMLRTATPETAAIAEFPSQLSIDQGSVLVKHSSTDRDKLVLQADQDVSHSPGPLVLLPATQADLG
jgi:hypothetical protein